MTGGSSLTLAGVASELILGTGPPVIDKLAFFELRKVLAYLFLALSAPNCFLGVKLFFIQNIIL